MFKSKNRKIGSSINYLSLFFSDISNDIIEGGRFPANTEDRHVNTKFGQCFGHDPAQFSAAGDGRRTHLSSKKLIQINSKPVYRCLQALGGLLEAKKAYGDHLQKKCF